MTTSSSSISIAQKELSLDVLTIVQTMSLASGESL